MAIRPIRYTRAWTKQPQKPVGIDWSNPLTRGLVTVFLPITPRHRDLIGGGIDTSQYIAPINAGSRGLALSNTNGGYPWGTLISVPHVSGGYSALTTFCLYEQPDTTTYGAVFGAGYDGTYYQGFSKNTNGTVSFGPATNSGGLSIDTAALTVNRVYSLCGVARYDQDFRELYVDGVSVGVNTASGTKINSQFTFMGSVYQGGRDRCLNVYVFYCWTRQLSESEIRSLTANPWQLFSPSNDAYFYESDVLYPSLLTNTNTFYSPTVSAGAVTLTPSRYDNTNTFYSGFVNINGVVLQPSLYTNGQTFYTPVVSSASTSDNSSSSMSRGIFRGIERGVA